MSPIRTREANKLRPAHQDKKKRGASQPGGLQQDPISQDNIIPNIDDFAVFIKAYKKLQSNVANLEAQVAGQATQIEQGKEALQKADEAVEEQKARDAEIELLRKEKCIVKQHNEELIAARTTLLLEYRTLSTENQALKKQVGDAKNHVRASGRSLEEYRKRVKALADEG